MTLLPILAQTLSSGASAGLTAAAIVIITFGITISVRPTAKFLLRRVANRAPTTPNSRWRSRIRRLDEDPSETAEERRLQRIDAAATMLSRLASLVIWTIAAVLVLHELNINLAIALSGAGFLGAAVAIGGQHSVNDFLTGIQILFEDRCGEGDLLQLRIDDRDIYGTVASLGAFSVRVESDLATLHISNRDLSTIVNLSQRGTTSVISMPLSNATPAMTVAQFEDALRASYRGSPGYDSAADGLVVLSVRRESGIGQITVRTVRALTSEQLEVLRLSPRINSTQP